MTPIAERGYVAPFAYRDRTHHLYADCGRLRGTALPVKRDHRLAVCRSCLLRQERPEWSPEWLRRSRAGIQIPRGIKP